LEFPRYKRKKHHLHFQQQQFQSQQYLIKTAVSGTQKIAGPTSMICNHNSNNNNKNTKNNKNSSIIKIKSYHNNFATALANATVTIALQQQHNKQLIQQQYQHHINNIINDGISSNNSNIKSSIID